MKKALIATLLATGVGLTGIQHVSANPGYGGHGMSGSFGKSGIGYQQPDKETKEKIRTFMVDNKVLRKEMAVKRSVRQAIMMNDHPDPVAAAKIAGELFDLRQAMREKAVTAGIAEFVGPRGPGRREMGGQMGGQFQRGRFCSGPPAEMAPHPRFGPGQLDAETKAKLDKFHVDNRDLKKKIVMKRAAKQALMRSEKIDYNAVAAVAGELFDLHGTMREKAVAAGVEQFVRPFGQRRFQGPSHFDMGRRHRGPGRS